ncbi:hypothetical protein LTR08_002042 [Meristemomyces frigidus]|nr:hypothetical protein LTR08_002042 [Meristemomyces frigidus]
MLDENLPAFFLKPAASGAKHHRDLFLSHRGSEPAPAYTLRGADPTSPSPAHKNCYAAALFDSYNPDVLYGEVLARPGWTQPTLSAEEMRRNGGVPPPPQPVLPTEFTVQLYNPDQQIRIALKEGRWGGSDYYEFSMPIATFRTPSASTLDRGQSDPASLAITPKMFFAWRKESKLSKDLTCFMTGSSTDAPTKKKSKRDPDIAVGLWRSMRELTIYEPNLMRLDMEDPKGLEVVLLLSAVVIKDLYLSNKDQMREMFNVSDLPSERKLSGGGRKLSNPQQTHSIIGMPNPLASHPVQEPHSYSRPSPNEMKRNSLPRLQTTPPASTRRPGPPPVADPRAQWELDTETARLKAQADAEAREAQHRCNEREKADALEAKRLQRMVAEEDREAQRRTADVDKETERLRKLYGVPAARDAAPQPQANSSSSRQRRPQHSGPYMPSIPQRTQANLLAAQPQPARPRLGSNGLYANPAASSSALVMSGANPSVSALNVPGKPAKKKSFFGLRSMSDDAAAEQRRKLGKKSSAMW